MERKDYKPDELKRLRESREQTQEQVAQALNVDRQTIYRAENGNCSYKLLRKLANYYDVDLLALLNSTKPVQANLQEFATV
jgi:transcriptional regulator with XRE-family HTH domain